MTTAYHDTDDSPLWVSTPDNPCTVTCRHDGEHDIRYRVDLLFCHPRTGEPYASIGTTDNRVYSERRHGPNGRYEAEVPCDMVRRVGG